MKKFSILLLSAFTLALISCTKDKATVSDPDQTQSEETGSLKLYLGFDQDQLDTRATAPSNATPTTKWSTLKSIRILFINTTSGTVKLSYTVPITITDATPLTPAVPIAQVPDVPVGTYQLIVLVNADANANIVNMSGGINAAPAPWIDGGLKNQALSGLFFGLTQKDQVQVGNPQVTQTRFLIPGDVFGDVQNNVTIVRGGNNTVTLSLAREVSMLRVRINPNSQPVTFATASCEIKVHRTALKMLVGSGSQAESVTPNYVVTSPGTKTTAPDVADYINGGQILVAPFTQYADIIIFPNTDRSGTNILQTSAPVENVKYVVSLQGALTAQVGSSPIGTPCYFSGVLDGAAFKPNQIVEANLTLTSTGSPTEITDEEFGNVIISATVSNWGIVTGYDMNI